MLHSTDNCVTSYGSFWCWAHLRKLMVLLMNGEFIVKRRRRSQNSSTCKNGYCSSHLLPQSIHVTSSEQRLPKAQKHGTFYWSAIFTSFCNHHKSCTIQQEHMTSGIMLHFWHTVLWGWTTNKEAYDQVNFQFCLNIAYSVDFHGNSVLQRWGSHKVPA